MTHHLTTNIGRQKLEFWPDGKVWRGRGIMQNLMDKEGVRPAKLDKEQFSFSQCDHISKRYGELRNIIR